MVVALVTKETLELRLRLVRLRQRRLELEAEDRKRKKANEQVEAQEAQQRVAWKACASSAQHFIDNYCYLQDTAESLGQAQWIPFRLWDAQVEVLDLLINNQKVIILKARQNGLTWLCLAFALWQAIFHPIATILVYSLRDTEAVAMLGPDKLEGMYERLPTWLRYELVQKSKHKWRFSNGSSIIALPCTAGDSYTATLAILDEADLMPNLKKALQRVQPTINDGGKIVLLSRSNKEKPQSTFKKMYKAARAGASDFVSIFLPWYARPNRTQAFYEDKVKASLADTGALDNVYESYPATDAEALAPATLDKRLPSAWINQCYKESKPLPDHVTHAAPPIPGLRVYKLPELGRSYRIGGDPAEGNPTSDDSAGYVVDDATGEGVAVFNGKFEPATFALYLEKLARFYNRAYILVERNNHGHAVLMALGVSYGGHILQGEDEKDGYLSNKRTKVALYDNTAEALKTNDTVIFDYETYNQLSLIEGATLNAPEGESDDIADACSLALIARRLKVKQGGQPLLQSKSKGWMAR